MAKFTINTKEAISEAIATARKSGVEYNKSMQSLGLQIIGHALAHGGVEFARRIVAAMNTKNSSGLMQTWLVKYGPFAYDKEDKALVLDKSKRVGLLNGAKPSLESAEKAMSYIERDAALWWDKPEKAEKEAEAITEWDAEEMLIKAVDRLLKKRGELSESVAVLNGGLLDAVVQIVKSYKSGTDAAVDATDAAKAEVLMDACIGAAKASAAQAGVELEAAEEVAEEAAEEAAEA